MQAEEGVAVPHSPVRSSVSPSSLDPDPLSITTACPHVSEKLQLCREAGEGTRVCTKQGQTEQSLILLPKSLFFSF